MRPLTITILYRSALATSELNVPFGAVTREFFTYADLAIERPALPTILVPIL